MDVPKVAPGSAAVELAGILDGPEVTDLIRDLEATRWTGRQGYPIRAMVGMALAKSMYCIPTWTRTARLVAEHAALRTALGCEGEPPSHWACYRFAAKLRRYQPMLDACIARVLGSLSDADPTMGRDVAIDSSDLPAYANGQRFVAKGGPERERFSDPDASWGHRSAVSTRKGGGFYGFKLHLAVDTRSGLPVAWNVASARESDQAHAVPVLDAVIGHGFKPETVAMDSGYDQGHVYDACEDRNVRPVIKLRKTTRVVRGEHKPPTCEHGTWTFAGSDVKRGASKWRCPTGECSPASVWVKADRLHPLLPRETPRWGKLYAGRSSVEREFGRLKHDWALGPLRVRGLDRVQLHADLTILAKLACALFRARAVPRAA